MHPALDDTADICPKDVQLPVFSMREIRKHNKRGDAWVVVSNLILDVGEFAKAHPGGEDILLTVAGEFVRQQTGLEAIAWNACTPSQRMPVGQPASGSPSTFLHVSCSAFTGNPNYFGFQS